MFCSSKTLFRPKKSSTVSCLHKCIPTLSTQYSLPRCHWLPEHVMAQAVHHVPLLFPRTFTFGPSLQFGAAVNCLTLCDPKDYSMGLTSRLICCLTLPQVTPVYSDFHKSSLGSFLPSSVKGEWWTARLSPISDSWASLKTQETL